MKNFRLLFVCAAVLFLDIATPFSACNSSEKNMLVIDVQIVDNDLINFEERSKVLNYSVIQLAEFMFNSPLSFILKSGTIINEGDQCTYEVEILSYEVVSYTLIDNSGNETEIELPYTFKEEDIINNYKGKSNVLRVIVNINAEYEIINESSNSNS